MNEEEMEKLLSSVLSNAVAMVLRTTGIVRKIDELKVTVIMPIKIFNPDLQMHLRKHSILINICIMPPNQEDTIG